MDGTKEGMTTKGKCEDEEEEARRGNANERGWNRSKRTMGNENETKRNENANEPRTTYHL